MFGPGKFCVNGDVQWTQSSGEEEIGAGAGVQVTLERKSLCSRTCPGNRACCAG